MGGHAPARGGHGGKAGSCVWQARTAHTHTRDALLGIREEEKTHTLCITGYKERRGNTYLGPNTHTMHYWV